MITTGRDWVTKAQTNCDSESTNCCRFKNHRITQFSQLGRVERPLQTVARNPLSVAALPTNLPTNGWKTAFQPSTPRKNRKVFWNLFLNANFVNK